LLLLCLFAAHGGSINARTRIFPSIAFTIRSCGQWSEKKEKSVQVAL